MGEGKIAFVFDTNFIVQNKNLDNVLKQLDEKYVPYVTQVSIEERKSQQCSDKKKAYEKVNDAAKQLGSLVNLKDISAFDNELDKLKNYIQQSYEKLFNGTIIKYDTSSDIFELILHRAFDKTPPFNDNDNASDKGFKDTLIWISIMNFFKSNGENEILFLTDDKGFTSKQSILIKEFEDYTGKKIQIKTNAIFGSLLKNVKTTEALPKKEIPNIDSIREQLQNVLENICYTIEYGYFGDEEYYKGFLTNVQFDDIYIKSVLDDLEMIAQENIFNDKIKVAVFLDKDGRIYNDRKIDIKYIEKLNQLYKSILEKYPEYSTALIKTITDKLNENYEKVKIVDTTDAPF